MIENIEIGKEVALGIGIGLLFIILNAAFGLVIGIPTLAFSSDTERYVVQDAVAPIVEEVAFRGVLAFALAVIGIPLFLNAVINIISFSIFHFTAYGANVAAASSLFIGAALFGLAAFLATYYDSDEKDFQVPLAAIIGHIIVNTWLGIKAAGLVFVGGF